MPPYGPMQDRPLLIPSLIEHAARFHPLVEKLAPKLATVRRHVAMTSREHMPRIDVPNLPCWDALFDAPKAARGPWPQAACFSPRRESTIATQQRVGASDRAARSRWVWFSPQREK